MNRPHHEISIGRQLENATFSLDLLDQFNEIEHLLLNSPDHTGDFTSANIFIPQYEPPESIREFLPQTQHITLTSEASRLQTGEVNFTKLSLQPEDGPPLLIERDETGLIALFENHVIRATLGKTAVESILQQALPEQVRSIATAEQTLRYLNSQAPESVSSIQKETDKGVVSFSRIETADDSIMTLGVTHKEHHPSNKEVYTKVLLSESLKQRNTTHIDALDHTGRSLSVEVFSEESSIPSFSEWDINELFNQQDNSHVFLKEIDVATKKHIEKFYTTIDSLTNKK